MAVDVTGCSSSTAPSCSTFHSKYRYSLQEEFEDTKRGIQNPYIEEGQTTQWPKEKVQKDKQRSTKHYTEN